MTAATCSKRAHPNFHEARAAAHAMRRRGRAWGWGFQVYHCDTCRLATGGKAWHWGHRRPHLKKGHRR